MIISNVDHRTCEHPDETVIKFTVSGVCICSLCGHRTAHEYMYDAESRIWEEEGETEYWITGIVDKLKAIRSLKKVLQIGLTEASDIVKSLDDGRVAIDWYIFNQLQDNSGLEVIKVVEWVERKEPVVINTGDYGWGVAPVAAPYCNP